MGSTNDPWWADWSWQLDGWIVVAGILCSVSAALLGNFLVLRRLSLLGDAISHAVLPGLAAAYLITASRSSWPMFVGAVLVGVLTAVFTQWIRQAGRVDEGASMGVVFTSLFALGLLMIVQAADRVDLDPGCVLYGSIELTPLDTVGLFPLSSDLDPPQYAWRVPRVVLILTVVLAVNLLFVIVFFKELLLSSFDPGLATSMGFSSTAMHYALMILVAITAVASFESVGNILVVAMFVVPPAAARLLTNRLSTMVMWSVVIAIMSAVFGRIADIVVPRQWGYDSASTSGMMAVTAGMLFLGCWLFSPQQGLIIQAYKNWRLANRILSEDILAWLYRQCERGIQQGHGVLEIQRQLGSRFWSTYGIMVWLRWRGWIERHNGGWCLTEAGRNSASAVVRSHRLWENYLAQSADVPLEQLHLRAERLEHYTDPWLRQQLDNATLAAAIDPHGSPIPPEQPIELPHDESSPNTNPENKP